MQFIFKNRSQRLYLLYKPQENLEFQQNIKHFSCLIKSTDSTPKLIPQSSLGKIQVTKTNCQSFDVRSTIASGCGQFREYSIKLNKSSGVLKAYRRIFSSLIKANTRGYSLKMARIFAPTVKLNNGYEMPALGLGTYELKKEKCENAIREAINIGYRHIDTAYLYGNESLIGKIIREKIRDQTIRREHIFLVTKLWNTYHHPTMIKYACRKQMDALQLDYIDLYLMHSPIGYKYENDETLKPHVGDKLITNNIDYVATYKAMEELVSLGWVFSLGLSNFNIAQMQRILDKCRIKPVTNQVECHPGLNQQELRLFCKQHDILLTAYSPLARPKASKPLPAFYESPQLEKIAKKYGKTKAQVVLRYLVDIGTVPIPKSSQPERLLENINIFDFSLSRKEIAVMDGFNTGMRIWNDEEAKSHKYYPFN